MVENRKGYTIFPNPVGAFLNMVFEDQYDFEIMLLNALGKVLIPKKGYIGNAKINVSELPSGSYWLKINVEGAVHWELVELVRWGLNCF